MRIPKGCVRTLYKPPILFEFLKESTLHTLCQPLSLYWFPPFQDSKNSMEQFHSSATNYKENII